jgi:hypothetical protein
VGKDDNYSPGILEHRCKDFLRFLKQMLTVQKEWKQSCWLPESINAKRNRTLSPYPIPLTESRKQWREKDLKIKT